MSYKKLKLLLIFILITAGTFFLWGCSQESGKEGVKGQAEIVQVEKAYDLLENLRAAEVVTKSVDFASDKKIFFTINDEKRLVLAQHPTSEIVFKDLYIDQKAKLEFEFGINQAAWDKPGDGVLFEIQIVEEKSQAKLIFAKYIDPKNNTKDRGWFNQSVDLSNFSEKKVSFVFKTTGGPKNDISFDWSGWSSARITWNTETALADYPINLESTKYDLLTEFPRAELGESKNGKARIKKSKIKVNSDYRINGEEREVILAYPLSEFSYALKIPDEASLEVGIGVAAESIGKDVKFEVYVNQDIVFSKHIWGGKDDSSWFDNKINLSRYSGKKVNLRFKTSNYESEAVTNPIMAGWSILRITGVIPVKRSLSSKDRPNIILIVIDTQRADHLTCYGYNRDTSPTLAEIAKNGVLFENAISPSSWTWPATASILTGLYPYTHGIINDESSYLVNSIKTLPELLQENHFTTIGITGNPLVSKDKNFDQGFETFWEMPWTRAEHFNHRFLKWLEGNKNLQFFAYLHYMDPHDPYGAPGDFYDMFDPDYEGTYDFGKRKGVSSAVNPLWEAINYKGEHLDYTERDIEHLAALYDGEIRYWDSQFAHLLDELRRQNVLHKTIIVITSDHGEEFLEHGKLKHGVHLYDETIKVPLIIWAPNMISPQKIKDQVETIDIYATLCKMVGLEIPNEIQGVSLVPWTESSFPDPYAYSQTEHAFIFGARGATKNSIRTLEWKLISTPISNEYELYSLINDKEEKINQFGNHSIGNELKAKLEEWVKTTKNNHQLGVRKGIDEETMKKLKSLGYIR